MRKILFILSAAPEISAENAKGGNIKYPIMSPSSTLLILRELGLRAAYTVELIDTRLHMSLSTGRDVVWHCNIDDIEIQIRNSDADIIGLSFLSSSALEAYEIAEICKRSKKTVIAGGLHATVAPDELVAKETFHYVYCGEAETEFIELVDKILRGELPRFPDETQIIHSLPLSNKDMNKIPAINSFEFYRDVMDQYPRFRTFYVELSRGCVKNCTFCEVAKSGLASKTFRVIPLDNVFRTVRTAIETYNANYVLVSDSIATLHKSHFLRFMEFINTEYPHVTVQFNSTVDRWDEDIAGYVAGMRCSVWFGFESGSQRILDLIDKGTRVEQAHEAAVLCEKYNISSGFNVLLGILGESRFDYEQTIQFFQEHTKIYPNPNILNPLPGTEIYRYCKENNLLRYKNDYSIWNDNRIVSSYYNGPILNIDYRMVIEYLTILKKIAENRPLG